MTSRQRLASLVLRMAPFMAPVGHAGALRHLMALLGTPPGRWLGQWSSAVAPHLTLNSPSQLGALVLVQMEALARTRTHTLAAWKLLAACLSAWLLSSDCAEGVPGRRVAAAAVGVAAVQWLAPGAVSVCVHESIARLRQELHVSCAAHPLASLQLEMAAMAVSHRVLGPGDTATTFTGTPSDSIVCGKVDPVESAVLKSVKLLAAAELLPAVAEATLPLLLRRAAGDRLRDLVSAAAKAARRHAAARAAERQLSVVTSGRLLKALGRSGPPATVFVGGRALTRGVVRPPGGCERVLDLALRGDVCLTGGLAGGNGKGEGADWLPAGAKGGSEGDLLPAGETCIGRAPGEPRVVVVPVLARALDVRFARALRLALSAGPRDPTNEDVSEGSQGPSMTKPPPANAAAGKCSAQHILAASHEVHSTAGMLRVGHIAGSSLHEPSAGGHEAASVADEDPLVPLRLLVQALDLQLTRTLSAVVTQQRQHKPPVPERTTVDPHTVSCGDSRVSNGDSSVSTSPLCWGGRQ